MPALAESAKFETKSHARVADGRIQPAHYPPSRRGFRYEDVTLTSRQAGRLGLDHRPRPDTKFQVSKVRKLKPSFQNVQKQNTKALSYYV